MQGTLLTTDHTVLNANHIVSVDIVCNEDDDVEIRAIMIDGKEFLIVGCDTLEQARSIMPLVLALSINESSLDFSNGADDEGIILLIQVCAQKREDGIKALKQYLGE